MPGKETHNTNVKTVTVAASNKDAKEIASSTVLGLSDAVLISWNTPIPSSGSATNPMHEYHDDRELCQIAVLDSSGSASVFIRQWADHYFNEFYSERELQSKFLTVKDIQERPFKVWMTDVASYQYEISEFPLNNFPHDIYMVSYGISDVDSFNNAKEMVEHVQRNKPNTFCVLLGQDVHGRPRKVNESDAKAFSRKKNINHYECVTKELSSVDNVMRNIVQDYRLARQNAAIDKAMPNREASNCIMERSYNGRYHYFRKQNVTDAFNLLAEAKSSARDRYKIRLALDIMGADVETEKAICSLLLDVFKDEYVYGVKFCPANGVKEDAKHIVKDEKEKTSQAIKEVPLGKEVDLYFTHPRFLPESKRDELSVLANHVRVIRQLDKRITELKLPITRRCPTEDHAQGLKLESGAISITLDHDEKDQRIDAKSRGLEEVSIYTEINEAAKIELSALEKEINDTKWKVGVFGGEKLFKDYRDNVPAGVKAIYDELKKEDDRTPLERLSSIKQLVTASSNYAGHGCFNRRNQATQHFYRSWHNRLNALVNKVRNGSSVDNVSQPRLR